METQLRIFKNPDFGDVRTIILDSSQRSSHASTSTPARGDAPELTARTSPSRWAWRIRRYSGGFAARAILRSELQHIANVLNISLARLIGAAGDELKGE